MASPERSWEQEGSYADVWWHLRRARGNSNWMAWPPSNTVCFWGNQPSGVLLQRTEGLLCCSVFFQVRVRSWLPALKHGWLEVQHHFLGVHYGLIYTTGCWTQDESHFGIKRRLESISCQTGNDQERSNHIVHGTSPWVCFFQSNKAPPLSMWISLMCEQILGLSDQGQQDPILKSQGILCKP